jgi:2-octaprenyl-6-methoxyphenol hydroxylase
LTTLGLWPALAARAQPITAMAITDSRTRDVVRPTYLTFEGALAGSEGAEAGEPFAHMLWSRGLQEGMVEACRKAGVRLRADAVVGMDSGAGVARVRFGSGTGERAHLVVAADGARSRLREAAGIGWVGWSYGQSGIVATIGHVRDHGGRAVEHFLPSGPFAILPLPPRPEGGFQSSIVWSERSSDVAHILALSDDDVLEEIESRFGLQLGALTLLSKPKAYPLSFGMARRFVGPRLALIGDAAHVIHPIAGQGFNLALKDVAALAEAVVDAGRLGLDPGAAAPLRRYEAARRFDTLAMGAVTDGLNRLFSNDVTPIRLARDLGLGLVDRLPGLKRFFINEAAAATGREPRLLRGEAL